METSDLIARAGAGGQDAFRHLVEVHSREAQVHCHRILGSLQDAEDALDAALAMAKTCPVARVAGVVEVDAGMIVP